MQRHILGASAGGGHVGQGCHVRLKPIQAVRGDPQGQAGAAVAAAGIVGASVVDVLVLDIAAYLCQGGVEAVQGGIQVIGLGIYVHGDDEFSSLGELRAAAGIAGGYIVAARIVGCSGFGWVGLLVCRVGRFAGTAAGEQQGGAEQKNEDFFHSGFLLFCLVLEA